jgi:hypothetical protein
MHPAADLSDPSPLCKNDRWHDWPNRVMPHATKSARSCALLARGMTQSGAEPADPSGIENMADGCLPSSRRPVRLGGAALLLECRDRSFELGRNLGALATVQAAAQLGTEFFDVVLKRWEVEETDWAWRLGRALT